MKKSMLTPAILVISMMIFPSNANANIFWLDIVRAAAKGLINIVKDASKSSPGIKTQASNQASAPAPNTAPAVEPTEQELMAAFDSLGRHCREFSKQGLPCGMHTAKSTLSPGNALEIANTRADGELAKAMEQFVKLNAEDILKQSEDDDGNSSESTEFKRTLEVTASQELRGAQTYITYSRVTKNDKGKDVYQVWVVRVLDAGIFERALGESSQGKSIGKVIGEFVTGFASKIKGSAKKKN
jgi:hypothetical protein